MCNIVRLFVRCLILEKYINEDSRINNGLKSKGVLILYNKKLGRVILRISY